MRRAILSILAMGLASWSSDAAGEKTHTVRGGESASSIARQYYGSAELGDFLLRYNERAGTVIRAGEDLRIPYCEVHRVAKGDSWSTLAMRYLGRAQVHPALAALNGATKGGVLRAGESIVIPVVLSHRLERGDTLASIAERYYGGADLDDLLQAFNEIEDPRRLSIGETVKVPLVSIRLREAPPKDAVEPAAVVARRAEPEAPAPEVPAPEPIALEPPAYRPPPVSLFESEIHDAGRAFAEGDYEGARRLLESLRDRTRSAGSDAEKAEVLRLLAFVYVAFDMRPEACAAFESMARFTAETSLDPDLVSPKIRDALSRCGA